MKAKLALFEASSLSPQNPKTFQPKNKGLNAEIFDWDEEEVSEDEEVTQVKVLMALADDETEYKKMKAKLALFEASSLSPHNPKTFQPKNKGLNAKIFDWDEEEVSEDEEVTQVKVLMALTDDEVTVGKSHARNGSFSKLIDNAIDLSIPLSKRETRLSETKPIKPSAPTEVKDTKQESKLNELTKLVLMLIEEKVYPNQMTQESSRIQKTVSSKLVDSSRMSQDSKPKYASSSKQISKAKAKPFPPCTHYGFNDHRLDDYRNYPECKICGSYDHSTSRHNRVIHIKGGVLSESSQSNESLVGVKCNTCGSTVNSTSDHNEFNHFKRGQTNQTIHMIMPSKDNLYNGQKGIGFENPSYFEKAKDLRLTLYDEKVIGLGYTLMFLTHSDEALEIKKFKRSRENKIEFAYDYGNLNASYVNEKINFEDDYFQEIINPDFDKIDSPFQQTSSVKPYVPNVILEKIIIDLEDEVVSLLEKEKENLKTIKSLKSKGFESSENAIFESKNQSENDCHVVEKQCDKVENPKVIAPGMFKLSESQSVSPISMSKTSCDSKNGEIKLKRKRRKRKSSKQNDKQVNNDVSRTNSDFVHF
nr:hypothetical protein [Tanacetum cinerariifolium]